MEITETWRIISKLVTSSGEHNKQSRKINRIINRGVKSTPHFLQSTPHYSFLILFISHSCKLSEIPLIPPSFIEDQTHTEIQKTPSIMHVGGF